ncbi:MAG: Smr/MutS family protein [Zetaproteobacteria bacterium]|nr:Smr/MutS family protein [Zetaproteobacteria bacterium]
MGKKKRSAVKGFCVVEDPYLTFSLSDDANTVPVPQEQVSQGETSNSSLEYELMCQAFASEVDESILAEKQPIDLAAVVKKTRRTCMLTVDLHGLYLEEAKRTVAADIWEHLESSRADFLHVQIVTGRGRRSGSNGAVLAREIHPFVCATFASYIVTIDTSPGEAIYQGVALRGSFGVVLRKPERRK